jgi:hypothetical protein
MSTFETNSRAHEPDTGKELTLPLWRTAWKFELARLVRFVQVSFAGRGIPDEDISAVAADIEDAFFRGKDASITETVAHLHAELKESLGRASGTAWTEIIAERLDQWSATSTTLPLASFETVQQHRFARELDIHPETSLAELNEERLKRARESYNAALDERIDAELALKRARKMQDGPKMLAHALHDAMRESMLIALSSGRLSGPELVDFLRLMKEYGVTMDPELQKVVDTAQSSS